MTTHTHLPQFLQGDSATKRGLRRVLGAERPVPERSDEEIAEEVARNYRWNYLFNLLDGSSFMFGISFASASTIMALFISKFTQNPLAVGILSVIAQGGWFLPQLFTANVVEQLPRKKPIVINLGLFLERLPFWVMVVLALLSVSLPPWLTVTLFLFAYAWHALGAGVVATAWQDLIARCFPVEKRGTFLGVTNFLGAGAGALGAAFSTRLLESAPFPLNFAYTFALAATFITLSWVALALVREPVQPVTTPPQSHREFWAKLPEILRRDHNFRRFLITRTLMVLGRMGSGFLTLAAVQRWQVSDATVGVYTGVLLVGQTLGHLIGGFLADRFGHKLSLMLGCLATTGAFGLAWLVPNPSWYYAVFALLGFTYGSGFVSGILGVMEFCEPERRPTYAGLANTTVGIVGSLAPLLGTALAALDYRWLFAISTLLSLLAATLMQWWVKEPRDNLLL